MVCDGGRQLPPAMETTRHPTSARPLLKTKGDTWGGKQSEMTLCYQVSSFACSACFCFLCLSVSICVCVCVFPPIQEEATFLFLFFFLVLLKLCQLTHTYTHTHA